MTRLKVPSVHKREPCRVRPVGVKCGGGPVDRRASHPFFQKHPRQLLLAQETSQRRQPQERAPGLSPLGLHGVPRVNG